MNIDNSSHYVNIYNHAIDKIFKDYDTLTSVYNQKHLKYSILSPKRDTDTCRKQFLSFMLSNFSNLVNMTGSVDASTTFLTIVEKVIQFIESMEVKTTGNQIVVTLHDIIDKLSSTSFDSDHCKSEKLFMAVLLAIQMLHCSSDNYSLVFKFAKSFIGPSGLQKTSKTCSGSKQPISSSKDPVAENIFGFDTTALKPVLQQQPEQLPLPPAEDEIAPLLPAPEAPPVAPPAAQLEEEAPADTMRGDKLFETYGEILPTRDQLEKNIDIEDYRQNVLSNFIDSNIESQDEICKLLLISCNGTILEKFKKLLFFKEIFASEYCLNQNQSEKCHKLYMIVNNTTIALQTDLLKTNSGGSKSRRRHRRKPARKTRRGRGRNRNRKSKTKTHHRIRHSRVRKHKKYTSRRR